jgi:hypothetical protein
MGHRAVCPDTSCAERFQRVAIIGAREFVGGVGFAAFGKMLEDEPRPDDVSLIEQAFRPLEQDRVRSIPAKERPMTMFDYVSFRESVEQAMREVDSPSVVYQFLRLVPADVLAQVDSAIADGKTLAELVSE